MDLLNTHLASPVDSNRELVVTDMEGTMSQGITWKALRRYLQEHGQAREVNARVRQMIIGYPFAKLGLIDMQGFKERSIQGLYRFFNGYSREELLDVFRWIIEHELWPNRNRRVLDEIAAHQEAGRRVIAVSGLVEPALRLFTDQIGIESIGTPLIFDENNRFTGEVGVPFITGPQKAQQIAHFTKQGVSVVAAYGDTYADIPMLSLAKDPVAVTPDSGLKKAAAKHGWRVIESTV